MPSEPVLTGFYDYRLVALSVVVAILASYAALDLAGRVTASRGRLRFAWLAGGATAMGIGIWSMHYIGMLAYSLPVTVSYHWPTVLWSLVAAVLASAIALFVISREAMGRVFTVIGGLLMGSGIAAMHYIGMEAMRAAGNVPLFAWTGIVVGHLLAIAHFVCGLVADFSSCGLRARHRHGGR